MRTSLECLVCFMRQVLVAARLSSRDPDVQRRVIFVFKDSPGITRRTLSVP
ncbi:MAG: hypothetical protein GWP11_03715 [Proteobacteria bacterium]|nr:hypothetical protein [Pseudomonadota bacterium]